jgi:hypothetical protein
MGDHLIGIPKFSDDFYMYMMIWMPVFAALMVAISYINRDDTKPTTPLQSGPLDR